MRKKAFEGRFCDFVEKTSERAKDQLPEQAKDASASVELKGLYILIEELKAFKRPAASKGKGVKLVFR